MTKTGSLLVNRPGLLTTMQDAGRKGFLSYGIGISGPMDLTSAKLANWLVGNAVDQPVLEVTFPGFEAEFGHDTCMAVCGADLGLKINDTSAPMNETIRVAAGDVVAFTDLRQGCRAYLSVAGGFAGNELMGSVAANTAAKLGSALRKGDRILFHIKPFREKRKLPDHLGFYFPGQQTIRVIEGPEFGLFPKTSTEHFFYTSYRISSESDRMGFRLIGEKVAAVEKGLISSGVVPGTIQVPPSEQPIILMADAQTTGGYPRIANVISTDLDHLAQMKPGDEVRFSKTDLQTAHQLLSAREKILRMLMN